ncbi:MAG TPA: CADD family putative folate metabolism protein [Thermoanaerobaculia bacterium]|jgi:pyrroloquinoline-quinone synthase
MDPIQALDARVASQHLLDHPFYQRWNAGELSQAELAEYARQYYHYALAFPTFLSSMHCHTEEIAVRQMLLENLIEEERGDENHPELWLRFCDALGLDRDEVRGSSPNEATRNLIDTLRSLAREGALHEGLAGLYAYESQQPSVAKTKVEGLARWFGITGDRDVQFFTVHMEADVVHSGTSRDLLRSLCDTPEKAAAAEAAAGRTCAALYQFLDAVN